LALYASLAAIFRRSLLHPLAANNNQTNQQRIVLSLTSQLSNNTPEEKFEDFPFSSPFRKCRQINS
jgi:hypothetical protein